VVATEKFHHPTQELLEQDVIWIDRAGKTHQVDTMDVYYQWNLYYWLLRNAERLIPKPQLTRGDRAYYELSGKLPPGMRSQLEIMVQKPLLLRLAMTAKEPRVFKVKKAGKYVT